MDESDPFAPLFAYFALLIGAATFIFQLYTGFTGALGFSPFQIIKIVGTVCLIVFVIWIIIKDDTIPPV
jgi:hypothetical protein